MSHKTLYNLEMCHFVYKYLVCKRDKQNLFCILNDIISYFNTIIDSSGNSNNLRVRLMYNMIDLRFVGIIVRNLLCVCGRDITRNSRFFEQISIKYYNYDDSSNCFKCVTIHNSGIFKLKTTLENEFDATIIDAINDALIIQPFFGFNTLFHNQYGLFSNSNLNSNSNLTKQNFHNTKSKKSIGNKNIAICKSAINYYRNIFESCLLNGKKILSKNEKASMHVTNDIVVIILRYMKPLMSQYFVCKDRKLGVDCQFHSLIG